jgi:arylsulfatase A-like enzyme
MLEPSVRQGPRKVVRTRRRLNQVPVKATRTPDAWVESLGMMGLATWFGLVTGLLELVLVFARKQLVNAATLGLLQMNRHAIWTVPVSDLLIFGACGIILALASLRWPGRLRPIALFMLSFLSALALLLTFRGLATVAYVALSCGLASVVARVVIRHAAAFRRVVRISYAPLVAIVAALVGFGAVREFASEHRALAGLPRPKKGAPNVLFIVLDTVRAQSLSLYGYNRDTSPHLTAFAREGVRFDRARTTASWTLPSHASMFTGRWAHELSTRLDRPLDGTYPTLAEYLRDHGYATAGFVANTFFCNAWYGLGRGFLHYEDTAVTPVEVLRGSNVGRRLIKHVVDTSHDRPTAYFLRKDASTINHETLAWLDQRPKGRPFFVFLNYYDAHDPYLTPAEPARRFGLRPVSRGDFATLRGWHRADQRHPTPREITLARDCYDDCIAYLDGQLGRLFTALEQRGILDDTIVVITSDHGEAFGEHGGFGHGQSLYREVINVPLLVVAPSRVPSGRSVREPVSLRDLPATVADLVGLGEGSPFPGHSLARHWAGKAESSSVPVEPLLTEILDHDPHDGPGWNPPRSLVIGETLYLRNRDGREELYNLDADPEESNNLVGTPGARPLVDRFRALLEPIDRRGLDATRSTPGATTPSSERTSIPSKTN